MSDPNAKRMKTRAARNWRRPHLRKLGAVVALLGGGSVFDACEVRLHDAFVQGTKDLVASFLDPANLIPATGNTASGNTTTP